MDDQVKQIAPERDRGGAWVTFGGEAYKVPSLSFGAIQRLQGSIDVLQQVSGRPTNEQMDVVLTIVHAALSRNYPSKSKEDVGELVDLENFVEVLGAVLQIAGFKPREEGGGSGEAPASTGTASTSP